MVESVYDSETCLLERFPLADTAEACNGGDGAVDIYVASLGHGDVRALTTTYPGRCNHVPSYIVVNSNDQALQQLRQNPAEGTRELKALSRGLCAQQLASMDARHRDRALGEVQRCAGLGVGSHRKDEGGVG